MILDTPKPIKEAEAPENKIIDMRGAPLEITKADADTKFCQSHHRNILVDEQSREIECKECGKVLDSFDYILFWANEGERRMQRLKFLDDEIRIKHNELETIKSVLAREKAKVRKINPDAPEVKTWRRELSQRMNP